MKKILLIVIACHIIFLKITAWHLPQDWIQKPITIDGVIDSIPKNKYRGMQFLFHTDHVNQHAVATDFLLSWYQGVPELLVGDHVRLTVKLKPPIGSHNPGGFDYGRYLLVNGITATGSVIAQTNNPLSQSNSDFFIARFREHLAKVIAHTIVNPALAAFISSLSVGVRDQFQEADWQVLQKTGTNHLVAIAGLHIGFLSAFIYFITLRVVKLYPAILLRVPASRIAWIVSVFFVWIYAVLSGFAIPAERACWMMTIFLWLEVYAVQTASFEKLALIALCVIAWHPADIIDMSFWLSFASIAMLLWTMRGRFYARAHVYDFFRMQLTIMIGLLPWMFLFFQQTSLIALITNAVAIPWVGCVILPMTLFATILFALHCRALSITVFWAAAKCLSPVWFFLKWCASLSFATWHHAIANPWVLSAGIIACIALLAPRYFPARFVGCAGLVPLFFYVPSFPRADLCDVTVMDVGQGLSVFIRTAHHVMLYDTGAHFPHGFDYGESVVAPYVRMQGIRTIDRLEISHGDNDHSGGAPAIMRDFFVKSVYTSDPALIAKWHALPCFAGQSWQWDGVQFQTLQPNAYAPYADNNSSCVIKITTKTGQLLLTGDIEKETERSLVDHYHQQLQSTILVVPHHGSLTSSSSAFLSAVMPRYAVISAGKYNRYHLPSQRVVDRYTVRHIHLYNTASDGAIIIRFPQQGQVKLSGFIHDQ